MKKIFYLAFVLLGFSISAFPQVIESFDTDIFADTTYSFLSEGGASRLDYSVNTTDFRQGTASAKTKFVIGAHHGWGSFGIIEKLLPDTQPMDWASSDTLTLWIKVTDAPSIPANMVFRVQLIDCPVPGGQKEIWVYENTTVIDAVADWYQLKIPLRVLSSDGSQTPVDSGFVIFPSSWGGGPTNNWNNQVFDADKIIGFDLAAVTSGWNPNGNLPADSVGFLMDGFARKGNKPKPAVFFNGILFPSHLTTWAWGQSAISVETGAGRVPNSNAIKWVQGNEWGNGWTGFGMTAGQPYDLSGAMAVDSMKFWLKCDAGVGPLRVQIEGGGGKKGKVFTPITDGQWHQYLIPLRDFVYQDNTTGFDSSAVNVIGLMAEASGVVGKVVYVTDWWTGNPTFDVIPPAPPTNVSAFAGTNKNIITWTDVPGETGEVYDIYYSMNPITDVNAPGVEVAKLKVAENNQLFEHLIYSPGTAQQVTYYYAIVCKDLSGNASNVSVNSPPLANTAKGVATVSLNPPTNFVANGQLNEWTGITPLIMKPSDGSGHIVTNTTISGDADLTVKSYVAIDQNYLYVAMDVEDDIVSFNPSIDSYLNDAPDLFIGFYNWHGKPHTGYQGGAEPDFHFRFAKNHLRIDNGGDTLLVPGANYYWGEKFPTGYVVEAKMSLDDIAAMSGTNRFHPVEGYRVPYDYSINDADATGQREGIMTYSPFNEDQSWNDVSRWLYTWIGNLWNPVGVKDGDGQAVDYTLSQNYPNPFNPSTRIDFTVKEAGFVTIRVYDMLGSEVAVLVNEMKQPGSYSVNFDASNLSSGMYLYKIETGSFTSVKKMLLVR